MDIKILSKQYEVKRLDENNIEEILKLYNSNPLYFQYCPPLPTIESVKNDLIDLPPNKSLEDKLFLGFIGLFMVDQDYSSQGVGANIINDLCFSLSKDYDHIILAWIIDNP